jgi:hypothetical protein
VNDWTEELEVFGIVMLSEKFVVTNPYPGEATYATGFVPTSTVNTKELAKNPTWQQILPLGFYPVIIAMGRRHNYLQYQLHAIEGLPEHIRAFAIKAAPVVVQEWLDDRLKEKYGEEFRKVTNEHA